MAIDKRILISAILTSSFIGLNTFPSEAASHSRQKVSTNQIIIDTGGGGGEGSALPGVKWTFAETPQGKPFIFWTWSATD
jgi:hypothetical protein